jgi:CDGSH iron-sulfur domain-containing protein 3
MSQNSSFPVHLEANTLYSWCTCGYTQTEPFCDSAHREYPEENKRSFKFQVDESKGYILCGCKQTKTPPFCDNSHKFLGS